VRRLGPRLADPDIETKEQVLTVLGVAVQTTRTVQTLSWALPLPGGPESDLHFQIDLSDVEEPDEEGREAWRRFQAEEEATACRMTGTRSASPAARR